MRVTAVVARRVSLSVCQSVFRSGRLLKTPKWSEIPFSVQRLYLISVLLYWIEAQVPIDRVLLHNES